ncbi:MAG: hypothetical protein E6J34_07175 [Chloroflexi bacterium]|nr:MAG: hypothetical protein E6J34_07175 [Chloroflexota bacterium]
MKEHQERIGQNIGDYRLVQWLGGGGFGNVYLAEHTRDHNRVAIKVLQMRLTKPDDWRSFLNEARMFRLRHLHIMPLLDFGLSRQDEPFLVMEYAPKGTLRDRHAKGSRLPLLTILDYATQVAAALQYAHEQHLVHRDVKPENMLLRSDDVLLLSDFGIATSAQSTDSVSANVGIGGTISYMAPEQLQGHPKAASDQYALGVVIYEWLTGHCPFQGTAVEIAMQHATMRPPSLVEQVAGLPHEVEEVLFTALAKDPKERFTSVQAFVNALQQACAPPSLHRSAPHALVKQPPTAPLPQTIASAPLAMSPISLTPPTVTDEPLRLLAQESHGRLASYDKHTPSSPNWPVEPLTMRSAGISIVQPVRKPGLSKGYSALLLVLILLLLAAGVGTYAWRVNASRLVATPTARTHNEATAIAGAASTATASAVSTATVKAAVDGYNSYVSQHGIMFGFDTQHTRTNPYERILNAGNVSQLHQAWATPAGNSIASSPTVANGLVYVGSYDGELYAFNATTGQQQWASAPTGSPIFSSPAVMGDLVYIGCKNGKLYAFDAASGLQRWVVATGDIVDSSPTVSNGVIYVGSADYKLYALDAANGQQKWVSAPTGNYIASSPAVANGFVYVASEDHKLYAFDAATGQQKWASSPVGGNIISSPAIANGFVYIASEDHKLYAFDATSGLQQWAASTGNLIDSSPAVANGLVYIGSGDHSLYAFDAATGQQRWVSSPLGDVIFSSPTVVNGLVYIASFDKKLYAFDATTGQQRWVSSPLGDIIYSSPAVVNGFVYIGSVDRKLYAFSLR